jgi:hypothetical protein
LGKVLRFRNLLAVVAALAALSLAVIACGDDDGDEDGTTAGEGGDAVLIKTHIKFTPAAPPTGEVLPGSFIGDSAFCPGGRFRDRPAEPPTVLKTLRCPDGRLTISFSPPRGPWRIVNGSGRFEGLRGRGRMRFLEVGRTEGRETFTGTISP